MDIDFAERGLFGGNITVELPRDWIDASDRQPVPDNQEAFLTRNGPFVAKLIFEITDPIDPGDGVQIGDNPNFTAVHYYIADLTDVTNDNWKSVEGPRSVPLELSSMHQYAAFYLEAEITGRPGTLNGDARDSIPGELPQPHSWLHLLLVRVPQYESEFVVQLIVNKGKLPSSASSSIAKQIMHHIGATLDFKSFNTLVSTPSEPTEQDAAMATGAA